MVDGDARMLGVVKELASEIEGGNVQSAEVLLQELTHLRESELFCELGKVTRQLHGALSTFELDACMSEVAEEVIPDTMARLDFVVGKTEEAAHSTLSAVEAALPICADIEHRAGEMQNGWARLLNREVQGAEFQALVEELRSFFDDLVTSTGQIQAHLTEVLMAQQYQDITGQVLEQVAAKMQGVQEHLVRVIQVGRPGPWPEKCQRADNYTMPTGPQIQPSEGGAFVNGQDDVDELLSSLGF